MPRMPASCVCLTRSDLGTVGHMNTLSIPPSDTDLADLTTLAPHSAVKSLSCPAGRVLILKVMQGRMWLTQEGRPEDHFLEAGQHHSVIGPALLHLSAEGASPVRYGCCLIGRLPAAEAHPMGRPIQPVPESVPQHSCSR